MNHFIALRPDGATRDRLAAVADRLRAWDLPASWTHADDLHLTLHFLGRLPEDEASLIPVAIDDVAGSLRRPSLRLAGLGAQGTRGLGISAVPHRVYAYADDPAHACEGIHRDLCECLQDEPQRAFIPHLTLCRPTPAPPVGRLFHDWPHLLEAHGIADWGACSFDALVLLRSTDRTPRYQELASWPLH